MPINSATKQCLSISVDDSGHRIYLKPRFRPARSNRNRVDDRRGEVVELRCQRDKMLNVTISRIKRGKCKSEPQREQHLNKQQQWRNQQHRECEMPEVRREANYQKKSNRKINRCIHCIGGTKQQTRKIDLADQSGVTLNG